MNQRIRLELFSLAMKVNGTKGGCVFVWDSPHVNRISFEVARSKEQFGEKIKDLSFYYDEKLSENKLKQIETFKEIMQEIIDSPERKLFKAEFDLGITKISKVFESEIERTNWLDTATKTISKKIGNIQPSLSELAQ